MRKFDKRFADKLQSRVEQIEENSGIELIVAIIPRVRRYYYAELLAGSLLSFVVLTTLMFAPRLFHYAWLYIETIAAFLMGALVVFVFPSLKRFLIGKKRLLFEVKEKTSALFQQGGIVETHDRIGVLLAFSLFEQKAVWLADKTAEELVPPDEWDNLTSQANAVFGEKRINEAILKMLDEASTTFSQYIYPKEIKVNELPDRLWRL